MASQTRYLLNQIPIRVSDVDTPQPPPCPRPQHYLPPLKDLNLIPTEPLNSILQARPLLHQKAQVCGPRQRRLSFRLELLPLLMEIDLLQPEV